MSGSVNKVILVGHIGKDPETRFSGEGGKIINFFFKESIITLWLCSHQISIWHVSNSIYQYSCLLSNPINGLRTICLASINCQFYIITQLGLPKTIICTDRSTKNSSTRLCLRHFHPCKIDNLLYKEEKYQRKWSWEW